MDDLVFAENDDEAQRRFEAHREVDPFEEEIAPALLHMEHVRRYVAKTGMICPFEDSPQHRKIAAYEVRLLGKCVTWDEEGNKQVEQLTEGKEFRLRPNSIAFVTLQPRFRLPNYIAVRFNLKITHVYRGLLAGTGPLVDPGYNNYLFLPLHNLTANEYVLRGGEPLVWMEFTKVSALSSKELDGFKARPLPTPTKDSPKDLEFYRSKADANRPIRSSIPDAVGRAVQIATNARSRIARLELGAIAAVVVAAVGLVWPIVMLVKDAYWMNAVAVEKFDEVKRTQNLILERNKELEARLVALERQKANSATVEPRRRGRQGATR